MRFRKCIYTDEMGFSYKCQEVKIKDGLIWSIQVSNNFPFKSDSNNEITFSDERLLINKIKSDYSRRGLKIFTEIQY